jgi:sugar phosphate permease
MCSNQPVSVAIIQWFERNRARALSAVQFGSALGGIFVVAVAWSIQSFGWRATALGSGILSILIGWPLARMIRSRPAEGEALDGIAAAPEQSGSSGRTVTRGFTAREALRTQAFWFISIGHAFSLFVVSAINVHAITHIKDSLGYSIAQASLVLMAITVGQFFGVMSGWVIGEKFEKRLVAAVCMLMHAAGLLMITYATGPIVLTIAALLHGSAWGLRGPFMSAMRADYFGRRSIGTILGLSAMILVIGQIGGPLVAGAFADATGNYRIGFTVLALLAGSGSLFFYWARPPELPG